MNLISPDLLKDLWIGYAIFCLLVGTVQLLRLEKTATLARTLPWIQLSLGALLFLISALELFRSVERPVLPWIYSGPSETSLKTGFAFDFLSATGLATALLIFFARYFAFERNRYWGAAIALTLTGWMASFSSETLWVGILGALLVAASGFILRIGINGDHPESAASIRGDLVRVGASLLGIWTSAVGLEVFGFTWNFGEWADAGLEVLILVPVFLVSLITFLSPWTNFSTLLRREEEGEIDVQLIHGILLPLLVNAILLRIATGVSDSIGMKITGFATVVLGIFHFFVYLASKSVAERRRAMTSLFASLALAVTFLEPSILGLMFLLGVGGATAFAVIGFDGVSIAFKRVLLVLALLIAVGLPGFLPGAYLTQLWGQIGSRPLEVSAILFLHVIFSVTLLREFAVAFFQEASGKKIVHAVIVALWILFSLTPWTTGTLTGGLLAQDFDSIPTLQAQPWVAAMAVSSESDFVEGRWIQLSLALLFPLLYLLFRRADPFLTEPNSWTSFRRGIQLNLGLSWVSSGIVIGFRWFGYFIEEKVLDRVWFKYLPTAGSLLHRVRFKVSEKIDLVSEAITDQRWNRIVSSPSYLVEVMTTGKTNWYLFFGILSTFILVLHFVVKLS